MDVLGCAGVTHGLFVSAKNKQVQPKKGVRESGKADASRARAPVLSSMNQKDKRRENSGNPSGPLVRGPTCMRAKCFSAAAARRWGVPPRRRGDAARRLLVAPAAAEVASPAAAAAGVAVAGECTGVVASGSMALVAAGAGAGEPLLGLPVLLPVDLLVRSWAFTEAAYEPGMVTGMVTGRSDRRGADAGRRWLAAASPAVVSRASRGPGGGVQSRPAAAGVAAAAARRARGWAAARSAV